MRLARTAVLLPVLIGALVSCWKPVRAAEPPRLAPTDLAKAELIAEPSAVRPGEAFWVGVRMRMREGWHTYWRNPGDSGEATSIAWSLPPGFEAGPIQWPVPRRIPVAHLANFGYDGEAVLLTRITPPASLFPSGRIDITADVTWLVCEKECVPGEAKLSLVLLAASGDATTEPTADMRRAFDAARAALPHASPWPARMELTGDDIALRVAGKGLRTDTLRSAFFFPFDGLLAVHAAPQRLEVGSDGLTLSLKRSALGTRLPDQRGGLLLLEERLGDRTVPQAFELTDVALTDAPAAAAAQTSILAVLQAAALALVGGLILNLMPCVFPVLSIKVLGLISHAGESARQVRRHGFAYTGGVLASFLALGIALLAVRAAGAEVGWGFQLQSPLAIAALAYLLFAMGLSMSGVFHFGASLQGVGQTWAQRSGLSGSFFAGALAAVVATPCTAPFMATAIGFAMTQSAFVSLIVFLALGLGLALPFLALTLAPGLVSRLPRPGAWMETLRQALAFPLYATVAWLMWVLAQQVAPSSLFGALIGLVLVGLGAWSFNLAHTSAPAGRRLAVGTVAASLIGAGVALYALEPVGAQPSGAALAASNPGAETFSQRRLDELRGERRPVFVNMTAAWCITCLVNEKAVLSTEPVQAALAAKNVAYLKGDWTNRNAEIMRVLEKHGRSGVPLYLLYTGNADNAEAVVLPQILTAGAVLAEIERIPSPRQRKASLSTPAKE